jgi:hypothetical protein
VSGFLCNTRTLSHGWDFFTSKLSSKVIFRAD